MITLATINLGRVAYIHKGTYDPSTSYNKYDVVFYNNGSYLYIGDTIGAGHDPTDETYWQPMLDPTAMNVATVRALEAAEAARVEIVSINITEV